MKKFLMGMLCLAMVVTSGCSSQPSETQSSSQTVTVKGHNDNVVLTVAFEGEKISAVTIDEHAETSGVADGALERVPAAIVENQSVNVDTVGGATVTSNAIIDGVKEAIEKQGLDINNYLNKGEASELEQGETETTDVVIVGAGVAGVMAAIELKTSNPDVNFIILEKMSDYMGSVPRAGGAIFAVGSDINKALDKDVDMDTFFEFMNQHSSGTVNEPLFRKAFGMSAETVNKLEELGIEFDHENMQASNPHLPQMHAIKTVGGGSAMSTMFHDILTNLGIEVRLESPATDLIVENGVVKGVHVQDTTKKYDILADKVILATGGFAFNEELMEKYAPEFAKNMMMPVSGTTGDGVVWTEQFGTKLVGLGLMGSHRIDQGHRGPDTKTTFIVDEDGKRFMDETLMYFEKHVEISKNADSSAYGIIDSNFEDIESLEQGVKDGYVFKFDTIEEVAKHFGIDEKGLVDEVNAYNEKYENKESAGFGIAFEKMLPMNKAPYYAFNVVANALGTIPGLSVNENCQILDGEGNPVENLYGAGELIMGNFFSNSYPGSGMGIGVSTYSGRIAATEAAASLTK